MKKILFVIVGLVLVGTVIIFVLFPHLGAQFLSGEDGWICQDGEWVKHGNPAGPAPTALCP